MKLIVKLLVSEGAVRELAGKGLRVKPNSLAVSLYESSSRELLHGE